MPYTLIKTRTQLTAFYKNPRNQSTLKIANTQKIPPLKDYKDLLNAKDLAEIFGVTKQTIYKELKSEKFGKPIKIGRTYKVPKVYILQKYFSA